MARKWIPLVVSLVLLLALAACQPAAAPTPPTPTAAAKTAPAPGGAPAATPTAAPAAAPAGPIKLGVVIPMGGQYGLFGQQIKEGMDLAMDDINAKGGIKGAKLELVYEDHKGDPQAGVSALRKVVTVDKVPAVVTIFTNVGLALQPVADELKVVLLSAGIMHPDFGRGSQWTFRTAPLLGNDAERMITWANKERGIKTLAHIDINDDTGLYTQKFLPDFMAKLGGKVLGSELYARGQSDFRTALTKLKATNADAVYMGGTGKEMSLVVKQMAELDFKPKLIMSNASVEAAEMVEVAGKAAEGLVYSMGTYRPEEAADPLTKTFVERFQAKYNRVPDFWSANFYDAIQLLAKAISDGGLASDNIRQTMGKMGEYKGISGRAVFGPEGKSVRQFDIKMVKDGKFVVIDKGQD